MGRKNSIQRAGEKKVSNKLQLCSNDDQNVLSDNGDAEDGGQVQSPTSLPSLRIEAGIKDPAYFVRLISRGTPVKAAKIKAGYATTTKTSSILKHPKCMAAATTVEAARKIIQATPGHTFVDNAEVLVEIRDNPETPENVRVAAIKELSSIAGYHAPQQVMQQNKSISLHLYKELDSFEGEELEALANGDVSV